MAGGPLDRGFDFFFGMPHSLNIVPYYYISRRKAVRPPAGRIGARHTEGWSRIQGEFWTADLIAPDFKHAQVLAEVKAMFPRDRVIQGIPEKVR